MDSAGPISHLHFPQNFLSSSMTNYITVQNNRIVNHALHPGTIIANTFIPQQLKYFYYEITVQNSERSPIAIGVVSKRKFKGNPLGKKDGYGLRNDARLLSNGSPAGVEWSLAQPWGSVGDTIGCGYFPDTRELFFTQGKKYCGVAFKIPEIDDDLTPCVCLGPQRVIHANFGSTEFVFNIFELIQSRDKKKVQEIYQVQIELTNIQDMIREYLLVNGYGNTLQLYEKAIHRSPSSNPSSTQLPDFVENALSHDVQSGDKRMMGGLTNSLHIDLETDVEANSLQHQSVMSLQEEIEVNYGKDGAPVKHHCFVNGNELDDGSTPASENGDLNRESGHHLFLNGNRQSDAIDQEEVSDRSSDYDVDGEIGYQDYDISHDAESDHSNEDEFMELEEDDDEEKQDYDERQLQDSDGDDDEDDDDEHDPPDEESKSEALADQLHSALQELSQTHHNVRYINRVYNQSGSDEPMLPRRRRSISSSLSSIVSGIRRATDITSHRSGTTLSPPTSSIQIHQGASRRPVVSLNDEDESKVDTHSSPIVWKSSLQKHSSEMSKISIRSLLTEDGVQLRNEFALRKTLALRSQTRQLMKQRRYSEVIQLLSPISSYFDGCKLKFPNSPAWIYLQCLLFIQTLSDGKEDVAFTIASTELLPHLIHYNHEGTPKSTPTNKKRYRESQEDGESSNLHLPVDSSSVNPSFLSQYFPSSQYPVIEKLLLDVISLFSVSEIPSIDGQKASSFPHDPIQSLHQYFESNEFLELVSDTLNIFLLHSIPNYHVPSHRTAIELCFYHLKQMNSLPNDKIKSTSTSTSWKYCAPGGKDDLDYNLYPVTWSASKKSKKFLGKNSQSEKLRKRCSR